MKIQKEPTAPTIAPEQGVELINRQITRGQEILGKRPVSSDAYSAWQNSTCVILEKCFGSETRNVERFEEASRIYAATLDTDFEALSAEHLQRQLVLLDSYVDLLQTELTIQGRTMNHPAISPITSRRVFLVHGRDEATKEAAARFLEKLQLEPVILHEQPNNGRTIIEKFTDYSNVGFAVILLTGDDRGGLKDEPFEKQKPRARQNVLFELGFFVGKLTRTRVCALYQRWRRNSIRLPRGAVCQAR